MPFKSRAQPRSRDLLFQILCAVSVPVAVLACRPFVETSFNDDWSYNHIALNVARTGHMIYDGWCSPTLLFQAFWGGLLIRHFGFSFELLRFSTLPFAIGCAVLCYRLARMAGLTSLCSLFAALAMTTSPLFIPLASSFMTDIYGCFFMLLSVYCGASAGQSFRRRGRVLWLVASVVAGYIGGLDRQTVYIAPGAVLLWAAWRWRRDRAMLTVSAVLLAVLGAGALFAVRWQAAQPLGTGMITTEILSWKRAIGYPPQLILTLTLLLLPVLASLWTSSPPVERRYYAISSILVLCGFALMWGVVHHLLFPWQPNLVTQFGILRATEEMRGQRPAPLNYAVRAVINVVVFAALVRVVALAMQYYRAKRREGTRRVQVPAVLQISGILAAVYVALLTYQARLLVFDRYLLPLLPLASIAILYALQKIYAAPLKAWNWAVLAVFALYGVAATQDYFASLRARLAAFEGLEAAGIPARQIDGGFELDGWTQMESAGRVAHLKPGDRSSNAAPSQPTYWFLDFSPQIAPRYFLGWSADAGLRYAALPGVAFRTWLPPFRREVKILVPDDRK